MEGGRGRNNFRTRYARDYINCPPPPHNLQQLPTPMQLASQACPSIELSHGRHTS